MAKKEETISLIDTFSEFKELKNIDRTTMVSVSWFLLVIGTSVLPSAVIVYSRRMLVNGD